MAGDLDLTEYMKDGSGAGPADLDWLDVDEESYRELDTLPKQNLDIVPDLKALWRHQDESASTLVPNTGAPRTMGDLAGTPMRAAPEDILRITRMAMMRSTSPQAIYSALRQRFDCDSIVASRTALGSVLAERGLLGGYYIDATDFPRCAQGGKTAKFVHRFAKNARFIKAKTACEACRHKQTQADSSERCGVFHKQLVVDIPYTEELAKAVEQTQSREASEGDPRARIKLAHLPQDSATPSFTGHRQHQPKTANVSAEDQATEMTRLRQAKVDQQAKVAARVARPIVSTLRKEMLKGRGQAEVIRAIKLAFDKRDLEATKDAWLPVLRQAGLYGAVYIDQPSFDDCRIGADFLSRHSSQVKAVVKGEKCGSCIFNKVGRCMMYGRKLVESTDEIVTPETVQAVLDEQKIAGNLPSHAGSLDWGKTPAEALRRIHAATTRAQGLASGGGVRALVEEAFRGHGHVRDATSDLTKRDVLKVARQYMNEGLYGSDLLTLRKSRFEVRDLVQSRGELKMALSEQGLQGIKYIDPTAYDDYGKGCKTAAAKHRTRAAVRYAKIGDKCASCVFQTRPGHCSVLNKELVREPPYVDKRAEQKAILASGPATEVSPAALINNGVSMINEFQLQQTGEIDLNPAGVDPQVSIEFGEHEVEL